MKRQNRNLGILVILLALFLVNGVLSAQNLTDKEGKKTGHWLVKYDNGRTQYEGDFIAGRPVGLMKRYDRNGDLTAEMNFAGNGIRCDAVLYYPGTRKFAEGIYLGKEKDSVWNYYSVDDGNIRIQENWKQGKLNGEVIRFFPNGNINEITEWSGGLKDGRWIQFFENGTLKLTCAFKAGLKEGPYKSYYPDSTVEIEGTYSEDLFHGTWKYFDQDGTLILTLEYDKGRILNKDVLVGKDEDFLKKIEENSGNMPDPAMGNY